MNLQAGRIGKRTGLLLYMLLLFPIGPTSAKDVPEQGDFAYGFPIITKETADFYSVDIPLQVYRSVSDARLRDAGVFDRAGQPVPRKFQAQRYNPVENEQGFDLAAMPLYGDEPVHTSDLKVLLQHQDKSTRIALESGDRELLPADKTATAYIIATPDLERGLDGLELDWGAEAEGFIGRVTVAGSDDLESWKSLGSATIADLRRAEAGIDQRLVRLKPEVFDYLRISWDNLPKEWRITRVRGIYRDIDEGVHREWEVLETSETDSADEGLIFDLGGNPAVDRVGVKLPADNSIIQASIYFWQDRRKRWLRAYSGTFYNLQKEAEKIESEPAAIAQQRAGRWKLVVEKGRVNAPVELQLGWRPDKLVFVAQGQGPYTLVTGRARAESENFPLETQFGSLNLLDWERVARPASLGPRQTVGGERRLVARDPSQWKTWLLWSSLALGVLVVGFMARSVFRELKQE